MKLNEDKFTVVLDSGPGRAEGLLLPVQDRHRATQEASKREREDDYLQEDRASRR